MSSWDKCTRGTKFNANLAKTQRTTETLRKFEGHQKYAAPTSLEKSDKLYISPAKKENDDDSAGLKYAQFFETQFSFVDLGLNEDLLKWIKSLGFSLPKGVQNKVLYLLSARKVDQHVIIAPMKSGKTSAVLLWVLNKLLCDKSKDYPKALMICPTYEIADTTYRFVEQVSNYCEIKIYSAIKGIKLNKDEQMKADLVIATPDKALELSKSNLKNVKYFIFDDAHCMSDAVGHLKKLYLIFPLLPFSCCIILCTSFCNKVLKDFIDRHLPFSRQTIEIENVLTKVPPKAIFIVYYNNKERIEALLHLEKDDSYKGQTVVFCRTKEESNHLKAALDDENVASEILNGNLKPTKRRIILEQFKENQVKLLITTFAFVDVLQAENLCKVITYEQYLNDEFTLDHGIYGEIENRLNGRTNCLIFSFIEQKWEDVLIKPRPRFIGEPVYPNARRISAKELIDGQNF